MASGSASSPRTRHASRPVPWPTSTKWRPASVGPGPGDCDRGYATLNGAQARRGRSAPLPRHHGDAGGHHLVGTKFLTADAPAAIASFGSGSSQISVRMISPREPPRTAPRCARTSWPGKRTRARCWRIRGSRRGPPPAAPGRPGRFPAAADPGAARVAVAAVHRGVRRPAPGASPGVPLRSADLAVTGDAAGRARQMAAFAHQLQGSFAGARIRAVRLANGQDVVRIAFAAPSPLGVLND